MDWLGDWAVGAAVTGLAFGAKSAGARGAHARRRRHLVLPGVCEGRARASFAKGLAPAIYFSRILNNRIRLSSRAHSPCSLSAGSTSGTGSSLP